MSITPASRSARSTAANARASTVFGTSSTGCGGHRSLKAVMDINCKTRQLDLPAVAYFRDPDGEGKRISASRDNAGNWVSIPVSPEDVINQAAKAYCP